MEEGIFVKKCAIYENDRNSFVHELSANDALLSGTEFNDDPTGILRRDANFWNLRNNDKIKALNFERMKNFILTLTMKYKESILHIVNMTNIH